MIRRLLGKMIEWAMGYSRTVHVSLGNGSSILPRIGYRGDAGYDLYTNKWILIDPKCHAMISTGVYIDPKAPIWFEMKARSSTMKRHGLEIIDAIIDKDFRGELFAIAYNPTDKQITIPSFARLAQIVPHHLIPVNFKLKTLSKSNRGNRGLGSSGV